MIDFGFDKIALIGAVALIVIGPEKLPKLARTLGHLLGKAQRYVADVKAEVNRSIELDELKKMKTQFEDAARNVEQEVGTATRGFESEWKSATTDLDGGSGNPSPPYSSSFAPLPEPAPEYRHPKKKWRVKRGTLPHWYKKRHGVRGKAQSGAARVARFRPTGLKTGHGQ